MGGIVRRGGEGKGGIGRGGRGVRGRWGGERMGKERWGGEGGVERGRKGKGKGEGRRSVPANKNLRLHLCLSLREGSVLYACTKFEADSSILSKVIMGGVPKFRNSVR